MPIVQSVTNIYSFSFLLFVFKYSYHMFVFKIISIKIIDLLATHYYPYVLITMVRTEDELIFFYSRYLLLFLRTL